MHTKKHVDFLLDCLTSTEESPPSHPPGFSDTDWNVLLRLAVRQSVAPLLYRKLNDSRLQGGVPEAIMGQLQTEYFNSAMVSMVYYREFRDMCEALHKGSIPFIALKGAHLAEVVYGDAALRPMADIDILVRERDLTAGSMIFQGLGYAHDRRDPEHDNHHHLPGLNKKGAPRVELHWHIQRPESAPSGSVEELFERSRVVNMMNVDVPVLCPEDLLLHLSIHASQTQFVVALKHVYDIRQTLLHYEGDVDWRALEIRALQWNAARPVFLMMQLAHDILAAHVSEEFLKTLRPQDFDGRYVEWAKEQVLAETELVTTSLARMYKTPKMKDKTVIILQRMFPPREFMSRKYSVRKDSCLLYLYYMVRPAQLLIEYGRGAMQMFRKGGEGLTLPDKDRNRALRDWLAQ